MWLSRKGSFSRYLSKIVYCAVLSLLVVVHLVAESEADRVIVHKQARNMELVLAGQVLNL
jgi:hypothetical protein